MKLEIPVSTVVVVVPICRPSFSRVRQTIEALCLASEAELERNGQLDRQIMPYYLRVRVRKLSLIFSPSATALYSEDEEINSTK